MLTGFPKSGITRSLEGLSIEIETWFLMYFKNFQGFSHEMICKDFLSDFHGLCGPRSSAKKRTPM